MGIHVLPCLRYEKQYKKPMPDDYPENPATIGEHIKKRRMDLKLFQSHVAQECGVTEQTVHNWERHTDQVQVQHYPKIFEFLGYEWFDFDTSTFPGKLKAYRYRRGMTQKEMAKIFNIDGSTIGCWESGEHKPGRKFLKVLEELLGISLPFKRLFNRPFQVSCPENPLTLGEHLRKKRLDLGLFQDDVAKILKIRSGSLNKWELNHVAPALDLYPRIIEFLGYFPFDIDTSSIGGKVKAYRYLRGMNQKELANMWKVTKRKIHAWEAGLEVPKSQMRRDIEKSYTAVGGALPGLIL